MGVFRPIGLGLFDSRRGKCMLDVRRKNLSFFLLIACLFVIAINPLKATEVSKKIAYILHKSPVYPEPDNSSKVIGHLEPLSWYSVKSTRVGEDGTPWVEIDLSHDARLEWVEQRFLVIRDELAGENPQAILDQVSGKSWLDATKAKVLEGTIDLAMTEEQLLLAWGSPSKIEEEVIDQAGIKNRAKKYCYGPYVVYVVNGIIARIP
jgi:hypothetical protein